LHKGDKVIAHQEKFGWTQIEPTGPCFSYISKKFVKVDGSVEVEKVTDAATDAAGEPNTTTKVPSGLGTGLLNGVVTADYVRVRAGSEKVPPDKADVVQVKLNNGATVQIVGQRDDFYKILSPAGTYFWVSSEYVKRLGAVTEEIRRELQTRNRAVLFGKDPVQQGLQEQKERQEYQVIAKLIEEQKTRPLGERNYTMARERLELLRKNAKSKPVLARLEGMHRQLMRLEQSLSIYRKSQQQDEQLRITLDEIEKKIQQTVALEAPPEMKVEDMVVQGLLAHSAVFTKTHENQRFLVLDDYQRIVYYAVSNQPGLDLNLWVGKKVSMIGKAKYDAFSNIRVLNVTRIVELPGQN
jgi:hypothetical protein